MTVAELRRFRAYRNMILAHGTTELYHEPEYNELKDKVLEYLDSFQNDTIRAIAIATIDKYMQLKGDDTK